MINILVWMTLTLCVVVKGQSIIEANTELQEEEPLKDAAITLECHRRLYTYRVTQTDENGRQCWDTISVMACWGRCDSKEISDWRFPYKKSTHPVCVHYGRNRAFVTLRHCEEGVLKGTDHYEYLEADDCKCQLCSSSDTSCEGLRYRPHRSHPDSLGFRYNFKK
ncbi:thyrostimulin beta-5 subunit [Anoplophora glabripennis]|uniref:thyrostimulin beta-5 subunit n=1 Tax=Anoplophora glabripennis TaxID=217634 RepID=UPI000873B579|nr:thyrostimulin beta-5 subunit [Anoplophora glabripennis]